MSRLMAYKYPTDLDTLATYEPTGAKTRNAGDDDEAVAFIIRTLRAMVRTVSRGRAGPCGLTLKR